MKLKLDIGIAFNNNPMYRSIKVCWFAIASLSIIFILLLAVCGKDFALPITLSVSLLFSLFFRFKVTVYDDTITYSTGIGAIIGQYDISNILECRVPNSFSSSNWHTNKYLQILILFGFKAVELTLKDGQQIILPTNTPHDLSRYICEMRRKTSASEA